VRCAAAIASAAALLVACGSSAAPRSLTGPAARSASSHVVVVVMENEERSSVIGSSSAPYVNGLARRYGVAARSYAISHPSLPNYLALVSGSTQGIAGDCTGCRAGGPNLATQLEAKGLSWKSYLEGLPHPCYRGARSGRYAKKHDPFAYWSSTDCRRRVSFRALDSDLRRGRLPAFALVTPDLCHDMHDCSVAVGDRFLAGLVPRLLKGIGPHGYVVLTFDEGASDAGCCGGAARGGAITTIVAGPDVIRGRSLRARVDHYGVLRTIEDTFGLAHLGAAADPRNGSLRGLFR
jgi:phosphatidylinositol-3-phosphatase